MGIVARTLRPAPSMIVTSPDRSLLTQTRYGGAPWAEARTMAISPANTSRSTAVFRGRLMGSNPSGRGSSGQDSDVTMRPALSSFFGQSPLLIEEPGIDD